MDIEGKMMGYGCDFIWKPNLWDTAIQEEVKTKGLGNMPYVLSSTWFNFLEIFSAVSLFDLRRYSFLEHQYL